MALALIVGVGGTGVLSVASAQPGVQPARVGFLSPAGAAEYAGAAEGRGIEVIIAGAGGAAHLPGMVAARTLLPVLGVPVGPTHSAKD